MCPNAPDGSSYICTPSNGFIVRGIGHDLNRAEDRADTPIVRSVHRYGVPKGPIYVESSRSFVPVIFACFDNQLGEAIDGLSLSIVVRAIKV